MFVAIESEAEADAHTEDPGADVLEDLLVGVSGHDVFVAERGVGVEDVEGVDSKRHGQLFTDGEGLVQPQVEEEEGGQAVGAVGSRIHAGVVLDLKFVLR